jgi:tetratricopeptide (TPR) repeat protein
MCRRSCPRHLRSAILAGAALLALCACVPLPRYRSSRPRHSDYPVEHLVRSMDPWLLTEGLADRVEIEVDWVEGCEPGPKTLDGLRDILIEYGPPGRPVEVRKDEQIPRSEWDAAVQASPRHSAEAAAHALGERHANPLVASGTEHRYVLFAVESRGTFGQNETWTVERDGRTERVRGVVMFRKNHEHYAKLWISLDEIERMTLVHEFGHQFGLVRNPRHERVDRDYRMHCTRLDCVMSAPTWRVYLRNTWRGLFGVFFTDYCPECRRDLRAAQAEFARLRAADPTWLEAQRVRRDADRDAWGLNKLSEQEQWSELLSESERLLAAAPGQSMASWYRTVALFQLGRAEEVLADYRERTARGAEVSSSDARILATHLAAEGRFDDALEVLEPFRNADLEDYEYEQLTYVLTRVLAETGRFSEVADREIALLNRGHAISFDRRGMERSVMLSLVRAGRFAEADARLAPMLRRKKCSSCLALAFAVRRSEGRDAEARAFAEQLLGTGSETRGFDAAWLYQRAAALEYLGRHDEASRVVDEIGQSDDAQVWVRGLVLTSRFEEALEALQRMPHERMYWTPCSDEGLAPLRAHAPDAALFAHCPSLLSAQAQ